MARVNVGVDPRYISDQHLIAESVEITMITGQLRSNNFIIKSKIPEKFGLRQGHMTFFKDKLIYLKNRLYEVNCELLRRGFNPSTEIFLDEFPDNLKKDWQPTYEDSLLIRKRIKERMITPLKAKSGFHKYKKLPIDNLEGFTKNIIDHKIYFV
jgi:deoxyribonuclease (pyrimidine dimer)